MRHEESVEVLLVSTLWLVVEIIVVDFPCQVLDHMHGIGETVIDWVQLLQENQKIGEEDNHLIGGIVKDLQDQVDVLFHVFDEGIKGAVGHSVNVIEEGGYEVALDFELLEVLIFSTHEEGCDFVVEIADDGFVLGLWVGVLVKLVG